MKDTAVSTGRVRGRLAPSPTGLLHLGNAWAFLLAWLEVRFHGGEVILRMEDLDPARSRREWADAIIRDLLWLGLDWDEGPDSTGQERGPLGPYTQSRRTAFYERTLARLDGKGLVYPCFCSRRELRGLASAPQSARADENIPYSHLKYWVGDLGVPYPGICRLLSTEERRLKEAESRTPALRLAIPDEITGGDLAFRDNLWGKSIPDPALLGGDFVLRRSDGVWAYQLAVVADDAAMGISHVVRGRDILASTPRQVLLLRLLDAPVPDYAHIPLLHDERGDRLAKRHGGLSLDALRQGGVVPETIIGWLSSQARWGSGAPLTARELAARLRNVRPGKFPWSELPRQDIIVPDDLFCHGTSTCS